MARQYVGSACSVCELEVKAEAADWGALVTAQMQDHCVEAAFKIKTRTLSVCARTYVTEKACPRRE